MSGSSNRLTVAVIIPVFNRSEVLRRTLASLQPQDHDPELLTVIVADDGSDEDVENLIERWEPPFGKAYVRQEHNGFGAARARNLGASSVEADILIFLDSDGIVGPGFVSQHMSWHGANSDAVVIGGRLHLQAGNLSVEDLVSGQVRLEATDVDESDDFRTVLSRRTSRYQRTDEGYRAFVSSNVSMPAQLFQEVEGFDGRFLWWSSEDTELGWRLWQSGAQFIDDPENRIYHQLDADTAGGSEGRERARHLNRGLLTSLVPHRFYRKGMPDPLPEVPKISVLVHDVPQGGPVEIWKSLRSQTLPDFEVIFIAQGQDHDPFAGSAEGDQRCSFVPDVDEAVWASRGEYVVFINGHGALSPTFLQNIRKRLDKRPASTLLTFGIEIPGDGAYGRIEDIEQIDASWGGQLPNSTAIRRRHLTKVMRRGATLGDALVDLQDEPSLHTKQALLAMPGFSPATRPDGFTYGKSAAKQVWEEAQLGPGQAFKVGLRMAKAQLRPSKPQSPSRDPETVYDKPGIRYVGWVGKENLGDEAMLVATRQLMSWGETEPRGEARDLLLLGGGTLINRNQYLRWLRERDSPRIERAVFGTGVASPDFWGITEDTNEWLRWLNTCAYVGVRGPKSAETLMSWGYKGELEICGDPALALPNPDVEVNQGQILIAPAWTNGELWGKSDDLVYRALAEAASSWLDDGHEIVLMSCHPTDDRPILEIREHLGETPTRYVAGYLDIDQAFAEIASSSVVIGERLHACVLAAAAGRPFVPIEYRPKVLDFALSVEMGEHVVRTDEISGPSLIEAVANIGASAGEMTDAVTDYRKLLTKAAEAIRVAIES